LIPALAVLSLPSAKSFLTAARTNYNWMMHAEGKWKGTVDNAKERINSAMAAGFGAVTGSLAFAPLDLIRHGGAMQQWEFDTDGAALESALFAVVYRYCTREDENPQLKQGVVGAFVIVRSLAQVRVPDSCEVFPLRCGPPFDYLNWDMLFQLGFGGVESAAAFGATALAIDNLANRGIISRFPSIALSSQNEERQL
jgi:hypothetical protein